MALCSWRRGLSGGMANVLYSSDENQKSIAPLFWSSLGVFSSYQPFINFIFIILVIDLLRGDRKTTWRIVIASGLTLAAAVLVYIAAFKGIVFIMDVEVNERGNFVGTGSVFIYQLTKFLYGVFRSWFLGDAYFSFAFKWILDLALLTLVITHRKYLRKAILAMTHPEPWLWLFLFLCVGSWFTLFVSGGGPAPRQTMHVGMLYVLIAMLLIQTSDKYVEPRWGVLNKALATCLIGGILLAGGQAIFGAWHLYQRDIAIANRIAWSMENQPSYQPGSTRLHVPATLAYHDSAVNWPHFSITGGLSSRLTRSWSIAPMVGSLLGVNIANGSDGEEREVYASHCPSTTNQPLFRLLSYKEHDFILCLRQPDESVRNARVVDKQLPEREKAIFQSAWVRDFLLMIKQLKE